MQQKMSQFSRVDESQDPGYFIEFLDRACAAESFRAYKKQTFELLEARAGSRIIEIGCGTGEDARAMAQLVGAQGEVVGVDSSEAMIAIARQRSLGKGLPVKFMQGDALHLDFPAGTFDGCRSDRTFMHLPDPVAALKEMIRVGRVGSRIVTFEVDFETLTVDVEDRALGRKIVNTWCDSVRNGWLGRHIPALYRSCGLPEIAVIPHALVLDYDLAITLIGQATVDSAVHARAITQAEGAAWLKSLAEQRDDGRFFSTLTGFIVAGRKVA